MRHIDLQKTQVDGIAASDAARLELRELIRINNSEVSSQAVKAGVGIPQAGAEPPPPKKNGQPRSNLRHHHFEAFRHEGLQALYGGRSPAAMASYRNLPLLHDRKGEVKYEVYWKDENDEETIPVRRCFLDFMSVEEMQIYQQCAARVTERLQAENPKTKGGAAYIARSVGLRMRQECKDRHHTAPEKFRTVEDIRIVAKRHRAALKAERRAPRTAVKDAFTRQSRAAKPEAKPAPRRAPEQLTLPRVKRDIPGSPCGN